MLVDATYVPPHPYGRLPLRIRQLCCYLNLYCHYRRASGCHARTAPSVWPHSASYPPALLLFELVLPSHNRNAGGWYKCTIPNTWPPYASYLSALLLFDLALPPPTTVQGDATCVPHLLGGLFVLDPSYLLRQSEPDSPLDLYCRPATVGVQVDATCVLPY